MRPRLGFAARLGADWSRSGLAATALGAVGFSFGIVAARVGAGATPQSATFAGTAEFSVWCGITGFEVALWAICWLTARRISRELRSQLPPTPVWPFIVVIVALVAAARTALFLYPTVDTPLYGMPVRQLILQCVGILAAMPALAGIWRIQAWLHGPVAVAPSPLRDATPPGMTISRIMLARESLQRLLLILSLMIGVVVFATGAMRAAYLAGGSVPSGFPGAGVLLFGALLTAALALLVVPVYVDLRTFQRRVREALSRVPDDGLPAEGWYLQRERLSALLRLDSGPLDAFRTAILLFGPFLSALVVLFVPDLKP